MVPRTRSTSTESQISIGSCPVSDKPHYFSHSESSSPLQYTPTSPSTHTQEHQSTQLSTVTKAKCKAKHQSLIWVLWPHRVQNSDVRFNLTVAVEAVPSVVVFYRTCCGQCLPVNPSCALLLEQQPCIKVTWPGHKSSVIQTDPLSPYLRLPEGKHHESQKCPPLGARATRPYNLSHINELDYLNRLEESSSLILRGRFWHLRFHSASTKLTPCLCLLSRCWWHDKGSA
jgi:hypothetical protein